MSQEHGITAVKKTQATAGSFNNNLLDTMVGRFGTGVTAFYRPDNEGHFVVTTQITIHDKFYGRLCGFHKMAKILSPSNMVADFQNFLDDIYGKHKSK